MTADSVPRRLAKIVLVALAYAAAAKGGLALAYGNSSVTAIWAPTGIALAALVLGGPRLWPVPILVWAALRFRHVGLLLGAMTSERLGARAALLAARDDLERQVDERTAELERIRSRLVEAQELAQLGSWEWDIAANRVTWSDALYRIYGVDRHGHEATFGGYLERVHPDDRERVSATIERALAECGTFQFDERIVRPDGAIRTLASRGQVFVGAEGSPERMAGICQDVTESRRAERALRESEERARAIVDAASDAFVSTDACDRVVEWNVRAEALFGWTREEALGRELAELVVPAADRARYRATIGRYLQTGEAPWHAQRLERDVMRRDGNEFSIELTIAPLLTQDGHTFNWFMHDITNRRRRERYLATEHAVSRVLLESRTLDEARPAVLAAIGSGLGWTVGGWWAADRETDVLRCQEFWRDDAAAVPAFERDTWQLRLGRGVGLPGHVWETGEVRVVPALAHDPTFPCLQAAAEAGLTAAIAVPLVSGGEVVAVIEFFTSEAVTLGDEAGETMARLGERVAQYVERKDAEDHLREAEERFHRAFEDAGTGMALIGVGGEEDGRFLEVNDALCASTRYSRAELLTMRIGAITHPEDAGDTLERVRQLTNGDMDSLQAETRLLDAKGEVMWTACSTSVIRDADGRPLYRIAQIQDITERKRFEGQLQHLADHDPVTALFNRRRLEEELARELAAAHRYGTCGAVLALDLDNFKYVNDTLGHSAGDELIAGVAEILRSRLRRTDTVARLGGDEFAIVLPHVDESQARGVAQDLLAAIRSEAVVSTAKGSRRATASIGIALFQGASDQLTGEELLVEADIAMYDAKEAGRDQACLYDAGSSRHRSLEARMTWGEQIREALEEDRFTLYAQPIVPLQPGGRTRHELLVRMVGRDGDVIPPSAFLPVAERFDLVQEIDRWVVRRAIELLAERARIGDDVMFDVNLSAKSLGDADLPASIAQQLQAAGVDPSRLVFEVTETAAIVNVDRARQFARRLGELGCGFALDDFGAGFASFYYLKHLPFDFLKIDGEFVESLTDSTTNQLVVQAVVSIARGLGKQTIAEYVGDEETLQLLRRYGVDYAQGFHVGRPVPVEEIVGWPPCTTTTTQTSASSTARPSPSSGTAPKATPTR